MYPGTATKKEITPKESGALHFKSRGENLANQPEQATPAVNITETPAQYLISIAAPGLHREDFSIEINDRVLSISASCEMTACTPNDRWEYDFSDWTRNFVLPADADVVLANAKYWNGEVVIRIPRGNTIDNKAKTCVYVY